MNQNNQFMDVLSVLSFAIGIENLDMNISQIDFQNGTKMLDQRLMAAVADIHDHLAIQDQKIDTILRKLEALEK